VHDPDPVPHWAEHGPFPPAARRAPPEPKNAHATSGILLFGIVATLTTYVVAWIGYVVFEDRFPGSLISIWKRWDALHYLAIARDGYGTETTGGILSIWPPLYSWCIRLLEPLAGGDHEAALALSGLFFLGTLLAFYRLVALDFPDRVAARSVLYLAIFPTAYFFHAAYSESLFTFLAVGSFLAARHDRWGLAGLAGGLAAMTRITWVALLPALLVEYAIQKQFRWRAVGWDLAYLLLMPLGFSVFLLINLHVYGDPLHFLEVQRNVMGKKIAPPWVGLQMIWAHVRAEGASRFITVGVFETVAVIGALVITLASALRLRFSYAVYMFLGWCNIAFTNWWLGSLRYWLPLFPAFLVLSLWGERRVVNALLCMLSLMTYTLLTVLFVRGWWTY
jgi:4-amino-4-deoxy-L-arabinose transferase-like glycosyltransferase